MRNPAERPARTEQGAALVVAVLTALLSAIAVYTVMVLALSQARQAQFFRERLVARNAAEAGVVWAQQWLWVHPDDCGVPDPPPASFDPVPVSVGVDVTDAGGPGCTPGSPKTIKATVSY